MAKEIKAAGRLGGSSQKNLPTWKKIDFYCCFILILSLYLIQLMFASLSPSTTLVRLAIPHDMMMQGPLVFNLTNPDLEDKPLECNPYYQRFRDEYMTDDIKKFVDVKSTEFLAIEEVGTLANETTLIQGRSHTTFAVSARGLCELVPPSYKQGSCMTYEEIESECLSGDCGTDPNVCFWSKRNIIRIAAVGQLVVYVPALLETFGLLFDPPPAKMHYFVHPLCCAALFLISGILSLAGLLVCMSGVKQFAPASVAESFPGFDAKNDLGYSCFLYCGAASIIFALCYFYLGFFTPKYPRQKNRWDVRRQKFEKKLAEIADRATSEV